ncbi:MAG: SBBP repeat-containing protein [Candidatus Omnitrophota bacterium]
MKHHQWILTVSFLILGVMAILSSDMPSAKREISPNKITDVTIDKNFGKMPLYFIPNHGQLDQRVFFHIRGKEKTIYFTSEGVTFALSQKSKQKRWIIQLEFVGARKDVKPVSLEDTGTVISYFKGTQSEWKTGMSAASKIMYRDLWPGIDLIYYGTVNQMKYEFVVHPGADPNRIKLAYHGVEKVKENAKGQIEVRTPAGSFQDGTPVASQEIKGQRVSVPIGYALETNDKSSDSSYTYGFSVGKYDSSQPLILDPAIIIYCGYLGGGDEDTGYGIAVDSSGCAYVTGGTNSNEATFPVKAGPDLTYNGDGDAFVAKVKADGTGLIYCGYIGGGSGFERGQAIAVDTAGCAYITGFTNSNQSTFPVTAGPDLTFNGEEDAFVAKIKPDGTGLIYCGYIGGQGVDLGSGIAVDAWGCAYVAGSTEGTLPVIAGPDLSSNGETDAFVAKVKPDGTGLTYCGYIGGCQNDYAAGIAVDGTGCAYIDGSTFSNQSSFPVKIGPDLTFNGNSDCEDAFVAKIKADGSCLAYCGYIGGSKSDSSLGIAVDGSGCAYVTGNTGSTETTFPVKGGPDLTFNGGDWDVFAAKVNDDGTDLVYCGYIGGSSNDWGHGIALDPDGCAYVAGYTDSNEITFPVKGGPDLTYNGGLCDAFVAQIRADGTSLGYCGYMGGADTDRGNGIIVDSSGNVYVAGETNSTQVTFPIEDGPNLSYKGLNDAFVAKVSTCYAVKFLAGIGGTLKGNINQVVLRGGTSAPVTALPNVGYQFVNWTGTVGFASTQNPLAITNVTSDMTVTANFATAPTSPGWPPPKEGLQYNMIVYGKAYKVNTCAASGDWIGAFGPGGVSDCRGVSRIESNGSYYLTIRSNAASGETVSFKLWPLPSGPSVNAVESLSFVADETFVNFSLHFGALAQKFNLVSGWNWISFNVLPFDTSLNSVFSDIADIAEQIKSQNKAALCVNGSWVGDLTNVSGIADGAMYKIKVTQARTLTVDGTPISFDKPLSLVTNWNWTAYLPNVSQTLEKALNTVLPQLNQVKSQVASAVKTGSTFIGDLKQMEPTKGYMIKMNASGTLIYPSGLAPSPGRTFKNATGLAFSPVPWRMIKGNQYNMIAYGNVYIDGKAVNENGYYLIGLGPGGDLDCRSISPVGKGGSFFATVLGNMNGEIIRFKLYSSKHVKALNTGSTIGFKADDLKPNLVVSF